MSSNTPNQPDQPDQPGQPGQPGQSGHPSQPGNQSTPAADDAVRGESNRQEHEMNREEELVQQLTRLVQDMETGLQRTAQRRQENASQAAALSVPWIEAPLTPSESLSSNRPLPWQDPPTPTTSVNPAELPAGDQTTSYTSIWPPPPRSWNLDRIRRRAEQAALEHIESQLRERAHRPNTQRRPVGGVWIGRTDQSGRMSRRVHFSESEVRLFVMRYEVERAQQEIDFICSGDDNTNYWNNN